MITVLFDASPIATNKKTGVGHYTEQLLKSLTENYPNEIKIVAYYYNFLGRKKYDLTEYPNVTYRQIKLLPVQLVNLLRRLYIEIPVEFLAKSHGNTAIFPNFIAQPSIFKTKKYIVLHDLSHIDHPEYLSDKNRKDLLRFVPKAIQRSEKVITVSEVSKSIIADYYAISLENIIVTTIPPENKIELTEIEISKTLSEYNITKPYVLYLGTLEPRKNILGLLDAYSNSQTLSQNYSLVLAGKMDWKFEDIAQKIKQKQDEDKSVIYCGYVSDTQRAALYSKASVFVLPSYYEGFGMMILESMQYKTPLAVSDIPVFHEVAKDSAKYFDPNISEDIANVVTTLLEHSEEANNLVATYENTLSSYSWQANVEKIMKEIEEK